MYSVCYALTSVTNTLMRLMYSVCDALTSVTNTLMRLMYSVYRYQDPALVTIPGRQFPVDVSHIIGAVNFSNSCVCLILILILPLADFVWVYFLRYITH
jgi:hypothetical protein